MKVSIPLKDIMIAPGKRFDPAEYTEQDVIIRIKKLYKEPGTPSRTVSAICKPVACHPVHALSLLQ